MTDEKQLLNEEQNNEASNEEQENNLQQNEFLQNTDDYDEENKTFFKRWFGKFTQGGIRGSMFMLIAAAIGPGCLALPNCFKFSGMINGIFFMIISAGMSLAALYSLFIAAGKSKTSSYAQCATNLLGYKHGVIVQVILIIYTFGGLVVRQVMIGKILSQFFATAGMEGKFADPENMGYSALLQFILAGLAFPIAIKKNLSSLRYISTIGVIFIVYIIFVLMGQTHQYKQEYWDDSNKISYFKFNMNFPNSFTLCVFVFTNYFVVFQVRGELTKPTQKRINKVIVRTVVFETLVYLALIFPAYYSLVDKMPDVILNRKKLDGHFPHDIAIQIARLLMSVMIFFSYPLVINPQRQGVVILHKGLLKPYINNPDENPEDKMHRLSTIRIDPKNSPLSISQTQNISLVTCILILSVALTVTYKEIIVFISILAGFFGCSIAIAYPAVLYIVIQKEKNKGQMVPKLYLVAAIGGFFSLFGYFSAILNMLRIFGAKI